LYDSTHLCVVYFYNLLGGHLTPLFLCKNTN
jgi:hypothetical protein